MIDDHTILNSAMVYQEHKSVGAAVDIDAAVVVGTGPVELYCDSQDFHFETTHQTEIREVASAYF